MSRHDWGGFSFSNFVLTNILKIDSGYRRPENNQISLEFVNIILKGKRILQMAPLWFCPKRLFRYSNIQMDPKFNHEHHESKTGRDLIHK